MARRRKNGATIVVIAREFKTTVSMVRKGLE
jgi:hypothetical protein